MGLQSDFWTGIAPETTYGAAATPSLFWESAPKLTEKITTANGKGYRPAQRAVRGVRNTIAKRESSGDIELTAASSGLGRLLMAAFGVGTVTALTGSAKQMLFTPKTTDYLPSYTLQQVAPILGSTDQAYTFLGSQCTGLDVSSKAGEGVMVKSSWVAKEQRVDVARATPSFAASLEQFTFMGASIDLCSVSLGGTYVAPTASTLASMALGEASAWQPQARDVSLSFKNSLDSNGFNLGSTNGTRTRPAALKGGSDALATGSFTAEFVDTSLVEAARTRTDVSLILTFAGLVDIAAGIKPVLQFAMPLVRLSTDTPTGADGDVITTKVDFTAYAPTSGEPITAVYRTLDAAL